MIQVFNQCELLKNENIYININKINSHIGIEGNENADKLAKQAAELAKTCKYNGNKIVNYNCNKNPVQIDIEKDLIRLRKLKKKERKMNLIEEKNLTNMNKVGNLSGNDNINDDTNEYLAYNLMESNYTQKELKRYRGAGIFIDAMVDFDYTTKNRTNLMKDELEYLNKKECEIIMKLRTEYINLNHYLHHIHYHADGNCEHCGVPETVSHFLLDCIGYKKSLALSLNRKNVDFTVTRMQLRKKLKGIAVFFKHEKNFNVKNILFPHTWQGNPKRDKDFKKTKQKYLEKRVEILKAVINFVNKTKRFKNDFGI